MKVKQSRVPEKGRVLCRGEIVPDPLGWCERPVNSLAVVEGIPPLVGRIWQVVSGLVRAR